MKVASSLMMGCLLVVFSLDVVAQVGGPSHSAGRIGPSKGRSEALSTPKRSTRPPPSPARMHPPR